MPRFWCRNEEERNGEVMIKSERLIAKEMNKVYQEVFNVVKQPSFMLFSIFYEGW